MSLVLKAFPMAFLISPDVKENIAKDRLDLKIERESLGLIKVATNLKLEGINFLMEHIGLPHKYLNGNYIFDNGLNLRWEMYNGNYCAYLTLTDASYLMAKNIDPANYLVKKGEEFFKTFDVMLKTNVRNVDSNEFFYYCYKTPYKFKRDVLNLLKEHKIENITRNSDLEIGFRFNNKNYKYVRASKADCFYLEAEQKISLINIVNGKKPAISKTVKTNYTNKQALIKTLTEYGGVAIESDDYNVSCNMFGMKLMYSKNFSQGSYDLEITQITDEAGCKKIMDELDDEYNLNVQDLTYRKIIENINKKNLRLESESVEDDNSIVLTIDIG